MSCLQQHATTPVSNILIATFASTAALKFPEQVVSELSGSFAHYLIRTLQATYYFHIFRYLYPQILFCLEIHFHSCIWFPNISAACMHQNKIIATSRRGSLPKQAEQRFFNGNGVPKTVSVPKAIPIRSSQRDELI